MTKTKKTRDVVKVEQWHNADTYSTLYTFKDGSWVRVVQGFNETAKKPIKVDYLPSVGEKET